MRRPPSIGLDPEGGALSAIVTRNKLAFPKELASKVTTYFTF